MRICEQHATSVPLSLVYGHGKHAGTKGLGCILSVYSRPGSTWEPIATIEWIGAALCSFPSMFSPVALNTALGSIRHSSQNLLSFLPLHLWHAPVIERLPCVSHLTRCAAAPAVAAQSSRWLTDIYLNLPLGSHYSSSS